MSCQSLAAARAFPAPAPPPQLQGTTARHRSVRFSSESQSSFRRGSNDAECKRETPGSISLTTLTVGSMSSNPQTSLSSMSQSAPSGSATFGELSELMAPPLPSSSCRFPKLEECAHFHYERVSLGGLRVEMVRAEECDVSTTHCSDDSTSNSEVTEGWVCLRVRSHVSDGGDAGEAGSALNASWTCADSAAGEWNLTRNADNFRMLDNMLHRCIYDRKVSGLSDLSRELTAAVVEDRARYESLVEHYLHHLSIIADDTINCGPVLNWLQVDNRGHRLLVANEDSSSINTPAVAAAYSVRKYVSQARDEISFEVGDMISIIDMPGPQESLWWRGKRGFRVGFFPHHCVAVIGDKVPRHMTQPPPIVGSVAVAPIKPVLRKHGKLISLFRSFILSRPSRRTLKQQGILRERVFGCDLGEHLLNSSHDVPLVLLECSRVIETHGAVDGIYRLSGGSGLTQRLRAAFDEGRAPDLAAPPVLQDIHAVASLLKMYFRELPNPLCTYQLYEGFVSAVQPGPEDPTRPRRMRETVVKLPPPHYRTLSYLMRHLRRVSLLGAATGMTARNMAIVWAPNLLRSPRSQHALQGVAVQAVVTEFLICYAEELFSEEQGDSEPCSLEQVELRQGGGGDGARRPKSLPLNAPTKLLSLEEARQRGGLTTFAPGAAALPPASGAIAAAAGTQLRPSSHKEPKYIEVGSGPNNLPQYHTVIELPGQAAAKRGLKRSPSGWRGLFSLRSKQQRAPGGARALSIQHPHVADTQSCSQLPPAAPHVKDVVMSESPLRPVKSCESLQSESEPLAPLSGVGGQGLAGKQHARSASCDSYFEPWQAELADMRLRLSPQERDGNIFSEEDDTTLNAAAGGAQLSLCSSPGASDGCSAEPSPRRGLRCVPTVALPLDGDTVDTKRSKLEEQLHSIGYIDGTDSPVRHKLSPEKRHSDEWPAQLSQADVAKRLCKDRDTPQSSAGDSLHSPVPSVRMRERSSPRKNRGASRYSGLHQPLLNLPSDNADAKIITIVNQIGPPNRLTWHGARDGHSTLIKIDWPVETTSVNSLTTSTLLSSPITPVTPLYDALESESEASDTNRRTIKIADACTSCDETKKCLKCELTDANDYENVDRTDFKVGLPVKEFGITLTASDNRLSLHDSLESSPVTSTNISYQNLNRLSNISTNSSNSDAAKDTKDNAYENVVIPEIADLKSSVMTSSHESSSGYSNVSPSKPTDELYECFSFNRPNYINLQSSGSSKCSSTSPLKSPLRSTISITFKSPTKSAGIADDYETIETPTDNYERDSVYEDIDLEKNLSIVEDATVPEVDASLPTQQACQPDSFNEDLIILESPVDEAGNDERDMSVDVYSQVKFFKKSIDEVNAMIVESPEDKIEKENPVDKGHYENIEFKGDTDPAAYENVCPSSAEAEESFLIDPEPCTDTVLEDKIEIAVLDNKIEDTIKVDCLLPNVVQPKLSLPRCDVEQENGNFAAKNKVLGKNLNVRELANKFESPTEQKGPFSFDKAYKADVKYPTMERKKDATTTIDRAKSLCEARPKKELTLKIPPPVSPKTYKLSKNSTNARSLDENAFVKEFGSSKYGERRKSLEVREPRKNTKYLPDLNLNTEEEDQDPEFSDLTPTTENKISLMQVRFAAKDYKCKPKSPTEPVDFDADKKLSRERIEKYKEERRNFLREKYSSQSFRSANPADHLTRLKIKRQDENESPSELSLEKLDTVELRNPEKYERLFDKTKEDELPKFERRNTVDLGQRMRFSLNRSANNLDGCTSRIKEEAPRRKDARLGSESSFFERERTVAPGRSAAAAHERKDKISPSYNIKDMAAIFEQKSHNSAG